MDNCSIVDNHLFSDHMQLQLIVYINVVDMTVTSRLFTAKQHWYNTTQCDIDQYK